MLHTQEWFDNEIAEAIKTRAKYFKSLKNQIKILMAKKC